MFDRWFKKETPLLGMSGMGGGVASNLVGGGASGPLTATGGEATFDTGGFDIMFLKLLHQHLNPYFL